MGIQESRPCKSATRSAPSIAPPARVSRSGPISASVRRSSGFASVGGGSNARRSAFHMEADPDRVSHITSWPLIVALSSVSPLPAVALGGDGLRRREQRAAATNGAEGRASASSTNPCVSSAIPVPYAAASMRRSVDSSAPFAPVRTETRAPATDSTTIDPFRRRHTSPSSSARTASVEGCGAGSHTPAATRRYQRLPRSMRGTRSGPDVSRSAGEGAPGGPGSKLEKLAARSCRMNARVGQEQRTLPPDRNPPSSAIPRERAILVGDRGTAVLALQDREQAMRHVPKERDGADPEHR